MIDPTNPLGLGVGRERDANLEAELDRQRKRAQENEDQLVWLAGWLRRRFGVENNAVIGREGWPHRLVEVAAKAVDAKVDRLEAALRKIAEAADVTDPDFSIESVHELAAEALKL